MYENPIKNHNLHSSFAENPFCVAPTGLVCIKEYTELCLHVYQICKEMA